MSDLILHQYAESTFSEKVRALLGYKAASYQVVETSIIMPRPDLMPLTGGYRRIPVMQIGADIYCDTALICRVIDQLYPDNTIYPAVQEAMANGLAYWTDTFFFKVCVAVAFQPSALAGEPLFKDEAAAAAFMADRAQLSTGSNELGMSLEVAEPHFVTHLDKLERQLGHVEFLLGGAPTIVDFSTFHLIWFINQRKALRHYFDSCTNLMAWYERMRGFGHGNGEMISGAAALERATEAEPAAILNATFIEAVEPGSEVSVMPIDYGFQPVTGELLAAGIDEIALARTDALAGRLVVHFPRMGFRIVRQ